MEFAFTGAEAAFADEVRGFLREHPPERFPLDGMDAGEFEEGGQRRGDDVRLAGLDRRQHRVLALGRQLGEPPARPDARERVDSAKAIGIGVAEVAEVARERAIDIAKNVCLAGAAAAVVRRNQSLEQCCENLRFGVR